MKSIATSLLLALACFIGAVIASRVGSETERLAAAHQRLAILQYDTAQAIDDPSNTGEQSRWQLRALTGDVRRHQTEVTYWLGRYSALTPLIDGGATETARDPGVMFIAANAAFRSTRPETGDRKSAVERLDSVMQAYAEVLRADPTMADASFNYEYVARARDMIAKGVKQPKVEKDPTDALATDLPVGSTVHGRHGAPPATVPMDDFKTISPMRFDEREDQAQPGRGATQRRRG
jgi:hypothetical protein